MIELNLNREELLQAVNVVAMALPNKSTLPILEHLLLSYSGNVLTISATDQENLIQVALELSSIGNIWESEHICVPGKLFKQLLSSFNSETVLLKHENNHLTLFAGNGQYIISTLHGDEYLDLSHFDGDKQQLCTFTKKDAQTILNRCSFAVSHDDFRPSMTGFCMHMREGKIRVVTTDSFKLAYTSFESDSVAEFDEFIVPKRFVEIIAKINVAGKLNSISVHQKNIYISFENENFKIVSRLIAEKFVPYESVIPSSFEHRFTVDRSVLLSGLDRVGILANQTTRVVKLNIFDGGISLFATDEETSSEASETINAKADGTHYLTFNIKNLKEALQSYSGFDQETTFKWTDPRRPVVLEVNDTEKDLVLVMPIKL